MFHGAKDAENVYGSWVAVLLAYLEQARLYEHFANGTINSRHRLKIHTLICPSGPGNNIEQFFPNDYVANTGNPDFDGWKFFPENGSGIFVDLVGTAPYFRMIDPTKRASKVTVDLIYDGLSNTLLFSESLQAGPFAPSANVTGKFGSGPEYQNAIWEISVGFCWPKSPGNGLTTAFLRDCELCGWEIGEDVGQYDPKHVLIPFWVNACKNSESFYSQLVLEEHEPTNILNYIYSRPSSMHPGLVIVAFADGSVSTMSDTIEEYLLKMAMCPNDQKYGEKTSDPDLVKGIFDHSNL